MLLSLLACTGTVALDDSEVEADADTDSDTDSDADSDADSDTDVPDWYLFKTQLNTGYQGGQLVDHAGGPPTLTMTFYAPGADEPGCSADYDLSSQTADGHRWTLGLTYREGDCAPAPNMDPSTDVDHLIIGVEPMTWDLQEDLIDEFEDDWPTLYEPFVQGAHIGVDTTREIGWAWLLKVDTDMALVPGDNCAVPGATCLTELPDRAVIRTEQYYKLFVADLED